MPADRSRNLQTEEGPVNFEKMSTAELDAWRCEGLEELLKAPNSEGLGAAMPKAEATAGSRHN
jgi:hypothetical protein